MISQSARTGYHRWMRHIFIVFALMAAPAAAFTQDDLLRAELLPGWRDADGRHIAALSLTLAPGWKTYWRSPGEAGIPPLLDFAGSGNLAAVQLHWPSPGVFDVNGLQTIGYHDNLILPIQITPTTPGQPIELRLDVDLGVCRDICVPAHLELTASLPASGPQEASNPAIRAALVSQPKPAKTAGMTDIQCAASPIADGLTITTRMTLPRLGLAETVVVEPADKSIWVSTSTTRREGGVLIAVTDLVPSNGAPFALDRSTVRVTVISDDRAVDVTGCPAP